MQKWFVFPYLNACSRGTLLYVYRPHRVWAHVQRTFHHFCWNGMWTARTSFLLDRLVNACRRWLFDMNRASFPAIPRDVRFHRQQGNQIYSIALTMVAVSGMLEQAFDGRPRAGSAARTFIFHIRAGKSAIWIALCFGNNIRPLIVAYECVGLPAESRLLSGAVICSEECIRCWPKQPTVSSPVLKCEDTPLFFLWRNTDLNVDASVSLAMVLVILLADYDSVSGLLFALEDLSESTVFTDLIM